MRKHREDFVFISYTEESELNDRTFEFDLFHGQLTVIKVSNDKENKLPAYNFNGIKVLIITINTFFLYAIVQSIQSDEYKLVINSEL